ncbi:MAG: GNAT family N-acetyltransferase [Ewingella sp.]
MSKKNEVVVTEVFDGELSADDLNQLAETLDQAVAQGASIGFIPPFGHPQALVFWQKLIPAFRSGERRLLVARLNGKIVGTVQLAVSQPANGIHRADVNKLMVHPQARRLGIARSLMTAIEAMARGAGKTLLVLDTISGGAAEGLYTSLGYEISGRIPVYAVSTGGELESTTVMFKVL